MTDSSCLELVSRLIYLRLQRHAHRSLMSARRDLNRRTQHPFDR